MVRACGTVLETGLRAPCKATVLYSSTDECFGELYWGLYELIASKMAFGFIVFLSLI
jgi:hypothetical protein